MVGELTHLARRVAGAVLEPFVWPVQRVREEVHAEPALSMLLLIVLILCAVRALRGDRVAALALVPLSFGWVLFNGLFEGPTLVALSWSHGITASDLIALATLMIAAWRLSPVLVGR